MVQLGRPFWKLLARLGAPVEVRVDVLYDPAAGCFVGTSAGLPGLVCEAPSRPALSEEIAASLGAAYDPLLAQTAHMAPGASDGAVDNPSDAPAPVGRLPDARIPDTRMPDARTPGFYTQVVSALKQRGFFFVQRGNGAHEIWSNGRLALSVPLPCQSRHAANAVCRAAGARLRF